MRKLNEIQREMMAINDTITAEKREATAEELNKISALQREFDMVKNDIETREIEMREATAAKSIENLKREFCSHVKEIIASGQKREVNLTLTGNSSIANKAEATPVQVMDMINPLEPKSIYQALGMKIETGVPTDKIIWPYNTNAVAIEERGEGQSAKEETLDWNNIKPSPSEASLIIIVDNEAIDEASFDLFAFVQQQLVAAKGRYFNKKALASASFKGMHGPFSGTTPSNLVCTWKNIRKEVAAIASKNVDMSGFAYFGNAQATAILETTPKAEGQGGFILENGKIGGIPYYETEYACYKSTGAGTEQSPYVYSFDSTNAYFGFGPFNLLALVGHGVDRLIVDPTTLCDKNQTRFVLHTKNSLTDLTTTTGCFKMVKLTEPA